MAMVLSTAPIFSMGTLMAASGRAASGERRAASGPDPALPRGPRLRSKPSPLQAARGEEDPAGQLPQSAPEPRDCPLVVAGGISTNMLESEPVAATGLKLVTGSCHFMGISNGGNGHRLQNWHRPCTPVEGSRAPRRPEVTAPGAGREENEAGERGNAVLSTNTAKRSFTDEIKDQITPQLITQAS
ncbi:hypothetical protein EYF80_048554 [Liparis tanakae]|uniref:Uncharacterized protein n=1 Tax=Liparis tanakae TaxID=230148 RepID=A0A4Z2FJX6_9TELE|nr:hypothetical protein EYF80_048554 [Liparis tanakae]